MTRLDKLTEQLAIDRARVLYAPLPNGKLSEAVHELRAKVRQQTGRIAVQARRIRALEDELKVKEEQIKLLRSVT